MHLIIKEMGSGPSGTGMSFRKKENREEVYPDEQPHPSTNEHDENRDEDICSVGPMGLLVESVVWHGMEIDVELRMWQRREEPISILEAPYQNLKPRILKAVGGSRNRAEWHRGGTQQHGGEHLWRLITMSAG